MRRLLITLLTVAGVLSPAQAMAGDNSACLIGYTQYPADGATDVPINTVLINDRMNPRFGIDGWGELRLLTESGTAVSLDYLSYCRLDCPLAAKPLMDLEPNSTYDLYVSSTYLLSFTTGSTRDDEAPVFVPGEDDEGEGVVFSYEGSDDIAYVVFEVEIELGEECHLSVPEDGVFDLAIELHHRLDGEEVPLRVVDYSGNTTTASITIRSPTTKLWWEDDGCSLAGAGRHDGHGIVAPLIGLFALAWFRRRSRTRAAARKPR